MSHEETLPGLKAYLDAIRRADQHRLANLVVELFRQLYESEDERISSVLDIMESHGFSPETLEQSCIHSHKVLVSCENWLGTPKLIGVLVAARLDTPEELVEEKAREAVLGKGYKEIGHIYLERYGPAALFGHLYWADAIDTQISKDEEKQWIQKAESKDALAKLVEEAQAWGEYDSAK